MHDAKAQSSGVGLWSYLREISVDPFLTKPTSALTLPMEANMGFTEMEWWREMDEERGTAD